MRRVTDARRRTDRAADRLPNVFLALVRLRRSRFDRYAARVSPVALIRRTRMLTEAVAALSRRADRAEGLALERRRSRLAQAWRLADTLSYHSVLARGFAVVKDADGAIVKRAASVSTGDVLDIEFADGKVAAVAGGGTSRPKPAPRHKSGGGQGSLF
jgi:exodeoxyribonuclease VII large subunit